MRSTFSVKRPPRDTINLHYLILSVDPSTWARRTYPTWWFFSRTAPVFANKKNNLPRLFVTATVARVADCATPNKATEVFLLFFSILFSLFFFFYSASEVHSHVAFVSRKRPRIPFCAASRFRGSYPSYVPVNPVSVGLFPAQSQTRKRIKRRRNVTQIPEISTRDELCRFRYSIGSNAYKNAGCVGFHRNS